MKKICLLLALLLCMAPVLSACGANSSPEKAVAAALDVLYGDGDAEPEDYYAVVLDYNLDVLELMDSEEASSIKESIREAQKSKKDSLNQLEDMDEDAKDADIDDWSFEYEILYCNTYEKGDMYDSYLEKFAYVNTDIEDAVEEIAVVGVMITREYEKDGEVATDVEVESCVCYNIDGDWYIAE